MTLAALRMAIKEPISVAAKVAIKEACSVQHWLGDKLSTRQPKPVILVLSHMRSGSTLLHHVLASHPAIAGRGERNRAYSSPLDFARLAVDVRFGLRAEPRSARRTSWLLDQINHDRFTPNRQLLQAPNVRRVFLIRQPDTAIASMLDVLAEHYDFTADDAIDYYCHRLAFLGITASTAPRESQFFLTYEDLLSADQDAVLEGLRSFLNLASALEPSYRRFAHTGQRGDPSPAIELGRIEANERLGAKLPAAHRERAYQAFAATSKALGDTCQSWRPQRHQAALARSQESPAQS